MKRRLYRTWLHYAGLTLVGLVMVYPLIWLFFASFKSNQEIFGSTKLLPTEYIWNSYKLGWRGNGSSDFRVFFINTFQMTVPTVVFTILSSTLVGYGFARFRFPWKKPMFLIMISSMMLPNAVIIIPRYLLFKNFGWLNSYYPFIIPAAFATSAFFIFMMVQFFRGLPKELDESAIMDGCNSFTTLTRVLLPLTTPALFSVGIFQFIWTWNDFYNSLIYISSVSKFTVALGLRMSLDTSSSVPWNQIMAMSIVSIIPCIVIFFLAQKYFVEGIATTGIKG
jgi:ABC-type sugar transport system, permease component